MNNKLLSWAFSTTPSRRQILELIMPSRRPRSQEPSGRPRSQENVIYFL
ncbi:MAG: hypothetical protein ABIG42_04920 [bacterium]